MEISHSYFLTFYRTNTNIHYLLQDFCGDPGCVIDPPSGPVFLQHRSHRQGLAARKRPMLPNLQKPQAYRGFSQVQARIPQARFCASGSRTVSPLDQARYRAGRCPRQTRPGTVPDGVPARPGQVPCRTVSPPDQAKYRAGRCPRRTRPGTVPDGVPARPGQVPCRTVSPPDQAKYRAGRCPRRTRPDQARYRAGRCPRRTRLGTVPGGVPAGPGQVPCRTVSPPDQARIPSKSWNFVPSTIASSFLRREERLCRRIVYRDIVIFEGSLGFDTAVESWSQSPKM
ncbi:hypothetical protein LAZ67_4000756 [Cordylochernes scorpioides]|uniref:Uncharacterized protein n=1 Tax=Cordylochernes scorpioides TaxID=51811 RepID=A0ABY6KEI0_9ARAC|nr:hypothetical protein LAZ67_4000756 [Cordylochernes scorpioides]